MTTNNNPPPNTSNANKAAKTIASTAVAGTVGVLATGYVVGAIAVFKNKLDEKKSLGNTVKREFRAVKNGTTSEEEKLNDVLDAATEALAWPVLWVAKKLKKL
jgi:hypothetical protein